MDQRLVDLEQLGDFTRRLAAWADAQAEIDAVYLFGSWAEDRVHAASDVDVAVLANREIARERLWRLEDRWTTAWPEWVDLRLLNLAPIPAQFEIVTRGRRLWQRSLERVAEYESWVRRRYWDMEPWLERAWQDHLQRLWEQRSEAEREEYQASLEQVKAVHRRVRAAAAARTKRVQV